MQRNRQQGISPYLNNQLEPKHPLRRYESPNYDTNLNYLKRSNKSNASEERHQLNAIEDVLNSFFKGEAIVRSLIAKIDKPIIRNKFDNVAVQFFTSKARFQQKEKDVINAMREFNYYFEALLKNEWPYSFKFQHHSQLIDYKVLNDITKELNEHKFCKLIINRNEQIKFTEYPELLKSDSYRFLTKINGFVSSKVTKSYLESDILLSLKQLNKGKYEGDQSVFRSFSNEIHQQLLRFNNLLKQSTKQQNSTEVKKTILPMKSSQIQEEQSSKDKKQLSQIEHMIERKMGQLERVSKEVENISKKRTEIISEVERWKLQEKAIKEKVHLLRHKHKVIEVLQEEKKSLQSKIDQLTRQQQTYQQKLKSLKFGFQEQILKKTQQIAFDKQQLKDKDKRLSECDFEYQSLCEQFAKLSKQKMQLLDKVSIAEQESLRRLEMRQVKAAQEISQKQAALVKLKEQCSKKDQECKQINIALSELIRQQQENAKEHQREIAERYQLLLEKQEQIKGLVDQNELLIKKEQKLQRIIEGKEKDNHEMLKKLNETISQYSKQILLTEGLSKEKQTLVIQKKQAFQGLMQLRLTFSECKEQIASIKTHMLHFEKYFTKEFQQCTKASNLLASKNTSLMLSLEQKMKEHDENRVIQTAQADNQRLQQQNEENQRFNELIDTMKTQISQKDRELQDKLKLKEQIYLLQQQNQRLQSTLYSIDASRLQERLIFEQLRRQNEKLTNELQSQKDEIKDAQLKFADIIEKQNQQNDKAISQLKQSLQQENAEKEIKKMQEISSLTAIINKLRKENESKLQNITSMASRLGQIQAHNAQLTANNANLFAQNDRLTGEKQAIQKDFYELSQKFKKILEESRQLQSRLQSAQSQTQLLEQYKAEFKQLSNESSVQVNKNKQLEKQLAQLREELSKQKENSLKMAQQAQENSNIYRHLQSQKQQLEKDVKALKESNKSSFPPEQKKKLQKKIRQYKEQIDQLTQQIDRINQNMEEVSRMNLENDLQAGKMKYQEEKAKIEKLSQQLALQNKAYKEELKLKQQQIKSYINEAEQLGKNFKDLQQQIYTQKQSYQQQIEELVSKIKAIELQNVQTGKRYKDELTKSDLLNAKLEASQSQFYEMKRGINSQITSMGSSDIANDLLFQNDVLEGQIQHKKYLRQTIQKHMGFKIWKSRLIFRFDIQNKVNFHRYIDSKEHLVIVMKLKNGNYLAAYTEGSFQPQKVSTQDALIISITNQETFRLIDKSRRAITYDEYFLIFGNSEVRIRSQENKVFSNFAIANGYFQTRGKKVPILLGGGPSDRQLQFEHYEIYQLEVLYDL